MTTVVFGIFRYLGLLPAVGFVKAEGVGFSSGRRCAASSLLSREDRSGRFAPA